MDLLAQFKTSVIKGKRAAKTFLFMKFTTFFLLVGVLQLSAKSNAQITMNERNAPLEKVLKEIKKQSGYALFYDAMLLKKAELVNVKLDNVTLDEALYKIFQNQPLTYEIVGNKIITIKEKEVSLNENSVSTLYNQPILINVKGKIIDENGEPLEAVSVMVKGKKKGTTTNTNGEFEITNVDKDDILVFNSVNIETFEVKINGRTNLETISVKIKVSEIASITVNNGYQVISKERSTGATSRVSDEILLKRPTANIATALNGQIAGLVADPATGFTIRGRSSLSNASDRTPLLVVDGFPIEGGFSSINPNDVKSIDVLKDASATSIYGARAANGVIVIVTSKPKGKLNINFNSFISFSEKLDLDNYMNIANAATQIDIEDRLYNTFKNTNNNVYTDPYTQTNGSFRGSMSPYTSLRIERDKGFITQEHFDKKRQEMLNSNYKDDFNKYLLRNGVSQQYNLVISGATEKNSYKFSALYDNDKTNFQYNNSNKVILSFTNIYNFNKNIKYTFNTNITNYNSTNNGINLNHARTITSPWTKLVNEEGNYTRMDYQNYEPLVLSYEKRLPYNYRYNLLEEASVKANSYRGQDLRIQNEFEFTILKGLHFKPMFQYESFNDKDESIYDERSYATRNYANWISKLDVPTNNYFSLIPKGGIYRKNGENYRQSLKFRAQFDYYKTINSRHEISALLGTEVISTTTEVSGPDLKFGYNKSGLNYALFDYAVDRTDMFNLGTILENSVSYEGNNIYDFKSANFRQNKKYNEKYFVGYFNGSYTLDNKYTATISMRTDASNYVSQSIRDKFSPFYSGGLRWNIANEKFMENLKFIDRFAIRATYGVTGNAAGKTSAIALSVFTSSAPSNETGNLSTGIITGRNNDYLTWEKTYTTNLGSDFSFFNGKLSGSLDFYRRHSKDLLSSVQTSQVVQSTSSLLLNLAEVMNKGIEISLGTKMNISKNIVWNGVINFDYNNNEVLKYQFLSPSLFSYLGTNSSFIAGLPTDRLMMVRLVGTTKDGYYIQQKKDGELIVANTASNSFADVGSFGMSKTIPGISPKDDNRIYYQGRTTPPATLGLTNTFYFKGFSLMAVITGRFGYKFIKSDEVLGYSLFNKNFSASGLSSIQSPSLTATTLTGNVNPSVVNQIMLNSSSSLRNYYSEQVVDDASHIRLNEIYIGYDLSGLTLGKIKNIFKSITIYTQARNLGLLWKANSSGIDPDYPIETFKPVKTYTFGVRFGM